MKTLQKMIVLTAVILFGGFSTKAQFAGGSGTQEDPYRLSGVNNLLEIHEKLGSTQSFANTYFILTNDIDLGGSSSTPWIPIGDQYPGLPFIFYGHIDGNGHAIKNMTITNGSRHCGFIAYLGNNTIRNLHFTNVNIDTKSNYENYYAGALAGGTGGVKIINCSASGVIKTTHVIAGGLIGDIMGDNALLLNCYARVDIITNSIAGGLLGAGGDDTQIINCYATGNITGGRVAGGLMGSSGYGGTIISNCYASGDVKLNTEEEYPPIGGLAGSLSDAGDVDNYWNTDAAQTVNGVAQDPKEAGIENAVGKTSVEMKAAGFVTLLNSNKQSISGLPTGYTASNWKADAGNSNKGYPVLISSTEVSVKDIDIRQDVDVYPIPAQSCVYVETRVPMEYYALYDITGVCLLSEQTAQTGTKINLEGLPTGVYLLHIATSEGTMVKKIIKN